MVNPFIEHKEAVLPASTTMANPQVTNDAEIVLNQSGNKELFKVAYAALLFTSKTSVETVLKSARDLAKSRGSNTPLAQATDETIQQAIQKAISHEKEVGKLLNQSSLCVIL